MIPLLTATGLGKRYGRRPALTGVDLDVPSGRIVGLAGPNGAGKSTLLGLAAGLLAPSEGEITVFGARPGPEQLPYVGFVAQDTPVYPHLTVGEHLRLGAELNPNFDRTLATARINAVGLDPAQRAGRLSDGQRAQLALAIAAAKRPRLLIFDEPVAALDPLARRTFLSSLMTFVAEVGISVLLSSHLIVDLERVCDYLIVLADGRVQVAGDIDELLEQPDGTAPDRAAAAACFRSDRFVTCAQDLDLVFTVTHQPHDRYWSIQLLELAVYTALAAVAMGVAFRWVRRVS